MLLWGMRGAPGAFAYTVGVIGILAGIALIGWMLLRPGAAALAWDDPRCLAWDRTNFAINALAPLRASLKMRSSKPSNFNIIFIA